MEDKLRKLQLTQLEMLRFFDRVCREHELHYSLYAGTLLGAVRHQGFIPWDDDLDVCMPREEYNRFLELWPRVKHEGFIIQNKENTPEFTQSFTKIRREHTTFLECESERGRYHNGIFIDVFPIDRIPNKLIPKLIFYWDSVRYQLYTREYEPDSGAGVKLISRILLEMIPSSRRKVKRAKLLKVITAYSGNQNCEAIGIETIGSLKNHFSKEILNDYTFLPFEGQKFMCFSAWDHFLQRKYGDYMRLPPEEERVWKHHPIIIDFTHNYEELINQ